ncbi:MAG: M56 family metallopeptidase [Clostridia bacterium]|nr:M56 family metallopeptidase [Clostridia bacterium]
MRTALLYNFLIEANLMASIAILLMMILRKCLRRQLGNGALCFGWLLVALRLLLPITLPNPLINGIRSPFAADLAIRPIAGQVKVRLTDALGQAGSLLYRAKLIKPANLAYQLTWEVENASLSISLAKIYAVGVIVILVWTLYCNARFRLRLRADRIDPIYGRLREQYEALCAERHIKPVPVYFVDPLPSACLVGVLRPYIALPLTASPQDAIHVLTHEVCHIKNGDHWWNAVRLLCVALHWFNPLVWLAASMSRTDGELRCDDRVTGPMDSAGRKAYANVLVLAAARRNAPGMAVLATGMTMTGRKLKTRIMTVMNDRRPLKWLSVCFMVLASMCLVGAFATAEMRYVPRLLRNNPAISQADIQSDEDAFAYADTIWAMPALNREKDEGLTWEVYDHEPGGDYSLYGSTPAQENLLFTHFDLGGNLVAIMCAEPTELCNASPITVSGQAQNDLFNDLKTWLSDVNPDRAKTANYFQTVQEYFRGDVRYVDIACWSSEAACENSYDVTAYFTVQIAPETRIIYYNMNYGGLNGNG